MRIVYDVLPHEEHEYVIVSGPYWSKELAESLLDAEKLPELAHFDPVSLRRRDDGGWYIVGKPVAE